MFTNFFKRRKHHSGGFLPPTVASNSVDPTQVVAVKQKSRVAILVEERSIKTNILWNINTETQA